MKRISTAPDRGRPVIATESLNYLAIYIVPITDFHIIILAHVVKLQAQHSKPRAKRHGNQDGNSFTWQDCPCNLVVSLLSLAACLSRSSIHPEFHTMVLGS